MSNNVSIRKASLRVFMLDYLYSTKEFLREASEMEKKLPSLHPQEQEEMKPHVRRLRQMARERLDLYLEHKALIDNAGLGDGADWEKIRDNIIAILRA